MKSLPSESIESITVQIIGKPLVQFLWSNTNFLEFGSKHYVKFVIQGRISCGRYAYKSAMKASHFPSSNLLFCGYEVYNYSVIYEVIDEVIIKS